MKADCGKWETCVYRKHQMQMFVNPKCKKTFINEFKATEDLNFRRLKNQKKVDDILKRMHRMLP